MYVFCGSLNCEENLQLSEEGFVEADTLAQIYLLFILGKKNKL